LQALRASLSSWRVGEAVRHLVRQKLHSPIRARLLVASSCAGVFNAAMFGGIVSRVSDINAAMLVVIFIRGYQRSFMRGFYASLLLSEIGIFCRHLSICSDSRTCEIQKFSGFVQRVFIAWIMSTYPSDTSCRDVRVFSGIFLSEVALHCSISGVPSSSVFSLDLSVIKRLHCPHKSYGRHELKVLSWEFHRIVYA